MDVTLTHARPATHHHDSKRHRRGQANVPRLAPPLCLAAMLIAPGAAAQAAPDIEPVSNFLSAILSVLTGQEARTAGAIAIAFGGYMMWSDRWPKSRFMWLLVGIMIVLGAPTIMGWMDAVV